MHRDSLQREELTTEDLLRAQDRWRVVQARQKSGIRPSLALLWLLIGPGILVMLGENDAPSMLSYAATGAQYGIGFFLPFILVTFGMAWVVQEMTVRLGAATHRGHAELIFDRFGRFWGLFATADLALGNFLTLVTEFIGMRTGLGFFGIPGWMAVLGGLLVVLAATLSRRYWTWERLVLALAIFNGLFVPVALLAHPNLPAVGRAFVTWSPLPGGWHLSTLTMIMADIGATVTPWMLFFQQSAVVDKGLSTQEIRHARLDTGLGAFLAAAFAIATVIATAPLFHHLSAAAFQSASFAQALQPYVGHVGAALFALGIFEAGLVAAVTISTSSAYAFGEVARAGRSLNRSPREAWPFYLVLLLSAALAGALVLIPGAPLESIIIIVNVFAVLAMPPALLFLLLLVNDREIMGDQANGFWANLAVGLVAFLITGAGLFYGLSSVFGSH